MISEGSRDTEDVAIARINNTFSIYGYCELQLFFTVLLFYYNFDQTNVAIEHKRLEPSNNSLYQ